LEFNRRILYQALDPDTPLLAAVRFLSRFSDNLDEYFMVRVAALKHQVAAQVTCTSLDGLSPQQQLRAISETLRPMVRQQHHHFRWQLRPHLAHRGIMLLDYGDLDTTQQDYLNAYVAQQILPVLTPLVADPGQPLPYLSNRSLNLAVLLRNQQTAATTVAWVKIPRVLPRLIPLPIDLSSQSSCRWLGLPLEQAIAPHLANLFPGVEVWATYLFRVTRDGDLALKDDGADDLLLAIEQEVRKRHLSGTAVRLEIQADMPISLRDQLMQALGLTTADVYEIDGMLGLGDLVSLTTLSAPDLQDPTWTPVVPAALANHTPSRDGIEPQGEDLFTLLRRQDRLLHHPYHSFVATVQQFISQAATDPQVLAIKMTLYRTSGDSPIVKALIAAAGNGKQVTVVVELKARFDEENNIHWARQLEQAGVHVVYGVLGLKTILV
jgi:polyphosphate kinase